MNLLRTKLFEVPEAWFDALMLAFKLPAVILPVWLLVWYALLPQFHWQSKPRHYADMVSFATNDFLTMAVQLSSVLFVAAGVLIVGGLIQLFCYSRRSAGWSLGFGVFALVIGIALAGASYGARGVAILNSLI